MIMKKTSVTSNVLEAGDVLRDEYRFDYTKSRPNRFAGKARNIEWSWFLIPRLLKFLRLRIP